MTPLAIAVDADDADALAGELAQVRSAGAELVELRASSPESLRLALAARGGLRAIAALRRGAAAGPAGEAERLRFFEQAVLGGAEFIEVELADWEGCARLREAAAGWLARYPARLILASEDAAGHPGDLRRRAERLRAVGAAALLRLGWRGASALDGIEALRLALEPAPGDPRPLAAVASGEEARISRLLAAKLGAPLAAAARPGSAEAAAGVPTPAELRELYRWDQQRASSAVFAVIGWPVGHSLSPAIHNAGFGAAGFDGVYVPLPVQPTRAAFDAALDALLALEPLRFRGASVTLPHKAHALEYVRERGGALDPLAAHIGAINTLLVRGDGSLEGLNSDAAGAIDALTAALGIGAAGLRGRRVAVLGAGGAAAAIAAALAHHGANTTVYNRTPARAEALAQRFDGTPGRVAAARWDELADCGAQIYINCTPIGMHPHSDASPLPEALRLEPGAVVFDTIYNPLETRLVRSARAAGATALGGLEMFVGQAAVQFRHFTAKPAPLELFRRVATERLSR